MVTLTLWPLGRWREALPAFRAIRPQRIMLHSDPRSLLGTGPTVLAALRKELGYPFEAWAGVGFDSGQQAARTLTGDALRAHLSALPRIRLDSAKAALELGASRLMLDPESAWKRLKSGHLPGFGPEDAREAVSMIRAALPSGFPVWATSYDWPTAHPTFPWNAWSVDGWAPQIYAYPEKGPAVPGLGAWRLREHLAHWKVDPTVAADYRISPAAPREAYVAAYKVTTPDTTLIADAFSEVSFWAIPARLDPDGLRAAWALSRVAALGYSGPGRVKAFQRAERLTEDSKVGRGTLARIEAASGDKCPWPFTAPASDPV